jgi:rhodanese-related sulfurtransferase
MKRIVMSLALALAIVVPSIPSAAQACEGEEHNAAKAIKKVNVPQLAELQKVKKARVFDANGTETRAKYGVIPGAVLLTSAAKFDAAKELPAEKDAKLVFYCANTQCTASDMAAKRAIEAGFTDVSVLPDGIMGWKNAGQKTATTPRS